MNVHNTYLGEWKWMWEGRGSKGGLSNSVYVLMYCLNLITRMYASTTCVKKKKNTKSSLRIPVLAGSETAVQSLDKVLRHLVNNPCIIPNAINNISVNKNYFSDQD